MVHSVYSIKDSFLRESISNASGALDKVLLEALRNKDLDVDTSDLHIEIEADRGCAHPHRSRQRHRYDARRSWAGIFYSTFMVADKIELLTRRARDNDRDR